VLLDNRHRVAQQHGDHLDRDALLQQGDSEGVPQPVRVTVRIRRDALKARKLRQLNNRQKRQTV
jgi:hypothetical protein